MMNVINPLFNGDYNYFTMLKQYPEDTTKIVTYLSPCSNNKDDKFMVMFGLQGYIKEHLINGFNKWFFKRNINDVINEYKAMADAAFGSGVINYSKIRNLHKLGYLPIEIKAIPEGTVTPIDVPMIEISNTHPDFVWVLGLIEPPLTHALNNIMLNANRSYQFRQIVNKYYDLTVDSEGVNKKDRSRAAVVYCATDQRMDNSVEIGAAHLPSFFYTDSLGAVKYIDNYYNMSLAKDKYAECVVSFKYDSMFINDENELASIFEDLLLNVYPNNSFTIVSDKDVCWKYIKSILPKYKVEIANHRGAIRIRCDVGDPISILGGEKKFIRYSNDNEMYDRLSVIMQHLDSAPSTISNYTTNGKLYIKTTLDGWYYEVDIYYDESNREHSYNVNAYHPTISDIGILDTLYNIFGGVVNKKGYIELPDDIKIITNNNITPDKAIDIYVELLNKGYAASNILLGLNQHMFYDVKDDGTLCNSLANTLSLASNATYYTTKNPSDTHSNNIDNTKYVKCCIVYKDDSDDTINYLDGFVFEDTYVSRNLMKVVFTNGKLMHEYTLNDIKTTLHNR